MANPNRRSGGATSAAAEIGAQTAQEEQTGEVHDDAAARVLEMVSLTPEEEDFATGDANLPILSWENTTEAKGGNLTDAGFASLVVGFEFRGYVVGIKKIPSEFGLPEVVMGGDGKPVIDPTTKAPIVRKMQEVYVLKGTARVPVKGSPVPAEVRGRMTIPTYARLIEPVSENRAREGELTARARKGNPKAPSVFIPLVIRYIGQGADRPAKEDGKQARSGAHIFEVKRLRVVEEETA